MKTYNMFLTEKLIKFNKDNNLPLFENQHRPESNMFCQFWKDLRILSENTTFDEHTQFLINSDIGLDSIYENKKVFLDLPYINEDKELNIPHRGGSKKYYVYTKNEKGNVVKVSFGDPELNVKINDPEARKAFASRHNCKDKTDKTTPGYWSCNLPRYAKYLGLEGGGNYFW